MQPPSFTIALAGNPNSGKTTIFNNLTGTRQKVGNWPGVTVEKKEGVIHRLGYELRIVDLPGIYSLTPFSIEEIVARDFLIDARPDVVIAIIDASNLDRSLYLATQLREIGCKVVFALNMADMARSRGIKIEAGKLSELLDLPVCFSVANKKEGMEELLQAAVTLAAAETPPQRARRVRYNKDIEAAIEALQTLATESLGSGMPYAPRWTAIKLLEDDRLVREKLLHWNGAGGTALISAAARFRRQIADLFDEDPEIVMTDERYGFIAGIIKEVQTTSTRQRVDISRAIDRVLTNRFLGFPLFIFFIWAMFQLTFQGGAYPMAWIDTGVTALSRTLASLLPDSLLKDLLLEGIVAGVGSVIVFLPNILILFFCIALFEDTGYMARAAFLMDKIMHLIGLHGKSFIPMLMGFGCNVPAIMASRTLENEKDRILTILITPFMSCSAKLPVYIVLAGTFFGPRAGSVIFGIYLTGILLSFLTGRLFRILLFRGEDAPFVMELPPYRVPMFKSLLIHMWDRSRLFLRKMAGVILIGSVLVWGLSNFPRDLHQTTAVEKRMKVLAEQAAAALVAAAPADHPAMLAHQEASRREVQQAFKAERAARSYMGTIGRLLAPLFAPLGIDWRGAVALATGFVAKEIVVSTLGVLHAVGEGDAPDMLANALRASDMTPLSALAMMVFVLLYLPCLASVAAMRRETQSLKWTLFSIGYSTGLAWLAAFCVFQGGRLLGFT